MLEGDNCGYYNRCINGLACLQLSDEKGWKFELLTFNAETDMWFLGMKKWPNTKLGFWKCHWKCDLEHMLKHSIWVYAKRHIFVLHNPIWDWVENIH